MEGSWAQLHKQGVGRIRTCIVYSENKVADTLAGNNSKINLV